MVGGRSVDKYKRSTAGARNMPEVVRGDNGRSVVLSAGYHGEFCGNPGEACCVPFGNWGRDVKISWRDGRCSFGCLAPDHCTLICCRDDGEFEFDVSSTKNAEQLL